MRIGVISDTHGYFDPQVPQLLRGVEAILHAGDVGTQTVIDQLLAIAPVHAVMGNVDSPVLGLPLAITRMLGDVPIHMLHESPRSQSLIRDWAQAAPLAGKPAEHCRQFLAGLPEQSRLVIFGHTHEPCALILGGRLFLNPGSAGKKRFSLPRCCAMLETSELGVRATFLGLERYNEELPEDVWLPIGGDKVCGNC